MLARSKGLYAGVIGLLLMTGCATVQLVSAYDEQTDQAAAKLQKDVATFFVEISSTASPEDRSFAKHQDFYKQASVELDSMQVRAGAIGHNGIIIEQLGLVRYNLAYLALLHKGCLTTSPSDAQKQTIRDHGIDSSPDCRVEYGASNDMPDRGASTLNPSLAQNAKGQLDQQLGAIEAFEVAKKRGDKEGGK